MGREVRNVAAWVRARLRTVAQANRARFEQVLARYALERLLFRLSESPHKERFVLKASCFLPGGLDLLAFGRRETERIVKIFGDNENPRWVLASARGTGFRHTAQRTVDRAEAGPEPCRFLAARSGTLMARVESQPSH